MEYWEWIYECCPKTGFLIKKSVGLGLRIVGSLEASKPGYRGRLGTKLLSHLHWTIPNSIMTWCMHIMEPPSQDTPDDGRCWNWCHGTTGGQGCPGMLPSSSWDVTHATGQRPSLHRRWGS